MKKLYYLLFYKLYCFGKALNEEGWEDWKALIAIGVLQIMLILEILVWCDIIFKESIKFSSPYIIAVPLALAIAILNYYALLHKDRWKVYAEEFKKYSKRKSRITSWIAFLFVIAVLGSLIFAFYKMSQIDWKQYRCHRGLWHTEHQQAVTNK